MFRYTSDTVFDTFPWPQFPESREGGEGSEGRKGKHPTSRPSLPSLPSRSSRETRERIRTVADAARALRALRALRRQIMDANGWSLRDLYRTLETPGGNKLRNAHAALDTAVRAAYGLKTGEDILAFLLTLNLVLAAKESKGEAVTPPGLPAWITQPAEFISQDCVAV